MLINQTTLADFFRGLNVIFQGAWDAAPSQYLRIATEVPSETSEEHYGWLNSLPGFRQWIGDRVLQSLSASDYTIKNLPYENTIEVDRDNLADDKIGIYKPMVQMLGDQARTHPDQLVFGALAAGFTTLCYDGQYFFDTDHPIELPDGSVSTYSNFQGGSGTPWFLLDVRRPIKPIIFQNRQDYTPRAMIGEEDESVFMRKKYRWGVDARVNVGYGLPQMGYASKQTLDATNYAAARAAMGSFKASRSGLPLATNGSLLVVPPSLEKAGAEVIKAQRNAAGADNVMAGTAELMVVPWLS